MKTWKSVAAAQARVRDVVEIPAAAKKIKWWQRALNAATNKLIYDPVTGEKR